MLRGSLVSPAQVSQKLGLWLSVAALTAVISLLVPTPANAQSTASTLNFSINSVVSLSLTNCAGAPDADSSSLTLDIEPVATGTFKSNCQTINVSTNTPGYSLSVKASSPSLTYQNPTTLNPKPTIPATTGSFGSPITLATNTWGYAVENQQGFDASYSVDNANNKYAALATTDTEIYQTNSFPAPVSSFIAYYGTKLDLATIAGQYQTTITYSAIGEYVPCQWDNSISFEDAGCVEPYHLARAVVDNNVTTMQELTGAICQSADYVGLNKGDNTYNTVTLTDTRNSQQYRVRKLADNKCWMIDNLKLELTNGMTFAPADTNVTSNTTVYFTQDGTANGTQLTGMTNNFTTSGYNTRDGTNSTTGLNLDAWRQNDPSSHTYCTNPTGAAYTARPGTTTGCGYLYNWFTATAGSGTGSISTDGTQVPDSICPANWRLPSGYGSTPYDFGTLNGYMAGDNASAPNSSLDSKYYSNW